LNDTLQAEGADAALDTEESGVAGLVKAWRLAQDDPKAKSDYQIISPYPGLRSFDPAESLLYFGRKGEDEALAKRLESFNVVGVLGGSGSGKSSLVLAGLLPYLKRFQRIPERGGRWYLVQMRPGQDPVNALIDAVWNFVCAPLIDQQFGKRALAETFDVSEQGDLAEACRAALTNLLTADASGLNHDNLMLFANEHLQKLDAVASGGLQVGPANLLIVIDQFEEIFRDKIEPQGPTAVAELIKKVHQTPRQGLFITLTMRSEEMHRCAEYEGLSEVIFASSVQIELLRKTEDLRAAIIEPARRAFDSWGIPYVRSSTDTSPFRADLIDILVAETQQLSTTLPHKPDSLPLLQHALRVIWATALSRWQQWLKTKPKDDWMPELTKDDFPWHERSSPFRACLDECADRTRNKALAEVAARLGSSNPSVMTAASYLIDMALASLARVDDNNRWVRSFASVSQIARESIVEVAEDDVDGGYAGYLRGFLLPRRRFRQLLEQKSEKEEVVAAALEAFVRAGYLFRKDGVYDVSHESLIRSWKYYQDVLRQARVTRDALHKADAVLTERDSKPRPGLARRISDWCRGGKSRQADEVLFGINREDLAKLFISPRWLGEHWAQAQLDAAAQHAPVPPDLSPGERLARVESTFQLAQRWKEPDGYWPPLRTMRNATFALPVFLLAAIVALPFLVYQSEKQLRDMLLASAGLSDEVIRNDPVGARNQLTSAVTAGKNIVERSLLLKIPNFLFSSIPGYLSKSQPVEETAFQILDQKARTVFRYIPGRVAEGLIPENELIPVVCRKAERSSKGIVNVAGLSLQYYPELNGFSFYPPGKRFPQSMPFGLDDIVCVAEDDGGLLMHIQTGNVLIYPLTIITKPDTTKSLQLGAPTPVAFYDSQDDNAKAVFNQTVANYLATNALSIGIRYFKGGKAPHKNIQAFVIPYEGKSIYIANIAGATYQPHVMERGDCTLYFKDKCSLTAFPARYGTRPFENLTIDGRQYTLEVSPAFSNPDETCQGDDEFCPQHLVLRRPGAISPFAQTKAARNLGGPTIVAAMLGEPSSSRMDFIYVGLPIVNAVADENGYVILLDTAGNVLQFTVGTNAFTSSMEQAGKFFFSQASPEDTEPVAEP
jgi:hypothetical protein